MEGVLLGPKTAAAAAAFFNTPQSIHGANTSLRPPSAPLSGKWFLTTSTISAGSGTSLPITLGTGTATMLEAYVDSGTRKLRSTGIEQTITHGGSATIASGRLVQCKLIDGQWATDVDYCGGGS